MAYSIGSNDLLDFSGCADDDEKESQCWSYYQENLSDVTVFAFDGKLVRGFTRGTFAHIICGSSNRFDPAIGHDIKFSEKRAKCLPLIKKVLSGEIETQVWRTLQVKGKKRQTRRVLTVIEAEHKYYVVVLDEVGERYNLRRAYPTSEEHYKRCIYGKGTNCGHWGKK